MLNEGRGGFATGMGGVPEVTRAGLLSCDL
jgi:hypothetical protein